MITQENIPYTADEIKAMVKTCEKYNNALEKAKRLLRELRNKPDVKTLCKYLFPELKESEGERIRKAIIEGLREMKSSFHTISSIKIDDAIAWLEKQGEQPTDKVEPNPDWSEEDEEMLTWLCRIIHTQRLDRAITLKEESELGEWIDKWLNHNPQTKQGEQPTDKVEPKFKVGDWVVRRTCTDEI